MPPKKKDGDEQSGEANEGASVVEEVEEKGGEDGEEKKDGSANEDPADDDEDEGSRKRKADDSDVSGKRKRKSTQADVYRPEDFTMHKHGINLIEGRGEKLSDLPSVVASIDSYSINSEEINEAFKLLFVKRGKTPAKDKKSHILSFSGYLKAIPADHDPKELAKEDEVAEVSHVHS